MHDSKVKRNTNTRLHSSRMQYRLLPVSPSMHCVGGGVPASGPGGMPASGPGGVYPSMQWGRPPCEQNDRCKNITLPQTSFAGGNYACF